MNALHEMTQMAPPQPVACPGSTRPHYHVPTPLERIANLEMTIARCQYEIGLLQQQQPPLLRYLRRTPPTFLRAKRYGG